MSEKPNDTISVIALPLILLAAAVFLFSGLLRMDRDMVLFTAGILCLVIIIKIWSILSLKNLECRLLTGTGRYFRGDFLKIEAEVFNRKILPVAVKISLPAESAGVSFCDGKNVSSTAGLLWYQRVKFEWNMIAEKRGIFKIGPVKISGGDFFGFYIKEHTASSFDVTIYPRILPVKLPLIQAGDLFGKAGKKNPVQDPVYILGTREYQHWQPARNIHWKASARYSHLMEKIFDPSEQEKVVLLLDSQGFSEAEDDLLFEKAVETAASVLYEMDRMGFITGFITNSVIRGSRSRIVRPGRNISHIISILETMAAMEQETECSIMELLDSGYRFNSSVSLVAVGFSLLNLQPLKENCLSRGIPFTGITACSEAENNEKFNDLFTLSDVLDVEVQQL